MNRSILLFSFVVFIALGIFFRFYNLNWSAPYFFHPDERNIASSVTTLSFPTQLNPHFFAYGSLPIYVFFLIGIIHNFFTICNFNVSSCTVSFEQAILISRICSALFSIGILFLIYKIGEKINIETGIVAVLLSLFSTGFIQFSHFGTFEMWSTFFTLLLFWYCCNKKISFKTIFAIGITLGILVATKVSNLILVALPAISFAINIPSIKTKREFIEKILITKRNLFFVYASAALTFLLTNPFYILDYAAYNSALSYESSVALGTLPVFYTGEFFDTIPIVFQFHKVYPFILNPVITVLFLLLFPFMIVLAIKNKNHIVLILILSYLLLFIPQAFIYTKWTRYMVPTLPFMYILLSAVLVEISFYLNSKFKTTKSIYALVAPLLGVSILFSTAYTVTAFVKNDTRLQAAQWAKENIEGNAVIVSEVYDLGITPFNPYFGNISLFNFYDLDAPVSDENKIALTEQLQKASYIILPSQRVIGTRILNKEQFPNGNMFYNNLLQEKDYELLYKTECDFLCKIIYLNNPLYSFEQTASVFDRPTVLIFKKK